MKRRGFLRLLGRGTGVAAAAVVAPAAAAKALMATNATGFGSGSGFGLAAVKREGATVIYDSQFAKALYPGVKKWWSEAYS
jgi:hypothetical protein